MGTEIERKFLVRDTAFLKGATGVHMSQGYLSTRPEATVRVRIQDERAWLTIKGKSRGATRSEFEYAIPAADARAMLDEMCTDARIEKTRYYLDVPPHTWEVDVFEGDNAGLVVAEIELDDEGESFIHPEWLGEEVTDDPRYANSQLVRHPWRRWT